MAKPKKPVNPLLLSLGVSLLIAGAAAYFILNGPEPIAPLEKTELFPYQDDETGLWGYLGLDAKIAIPAKFQHADLFHGLGLVEYDGKAGYIDAKGKWVIANRFVVDPEFEKDVAARPFWGGLAAARKNGAWGFITPKGDWKILPRYEGEDGFALVGDFHDGLAWFAGDNNRYGFINDHGEVVIEAQYHATNDFSEGLAGVLIKSEWGMIDTRGKLRLRPDFDGIGTFSQGLCPAKRGDQWGYLNRKGHWIIQPKYAAARAFSEGLAPAYNGHAWGYINPDGKYVIDPIYAQAWPHENGLASVTIDGEQKYIDANGKVAWPKPTRR